MKWTHLQCHASRISSGLLWWRKVNRERPVTVIMYHSVSPEPGPWTIHPISFERQIRFLQRTYRVIAFRNMVEALMGHCDQRVVLITFDDAYRNFAEYAHPVLEHLGVPSTLFVPTAYIGKWNEWDMVIDDYRKKRVMDLEQLRRIAVSPYIEIGSHTIDHARMNGLPFREIRRQARGSRRALEHLLGREIVFFSYPWGQLGDFSNFTGHVLAEAGYRAAVTSRWGSTNSMRQLFALRRISFEETDTIAEMRAKVEGEYDWYAIKEWAGYIKRRCGMDPLSNKHPNIFPHKPDMRGLRP